MKLKALILVVFFSVLAALSLSQSNIVSAQTESGVTSPVTYFTYVLRGKVHFRLLNYTHFIRGTNVTIEAKNIQSGQTFSAKTDASGAYTLVVKQASSSAHYVIKPNFNGEVIRWFPAQHVLPVSKDINNINFGGKLSTSSAKTSN